jgi:hypothetical protein
MASLRDARTRHAILRRLNALRPDATPRWGTMTAPRMLAHMTDAFRMAFGELPVTPKHVPIARMFPVKQLFLHVMPFPKNAPTARELISRTPDDFDAERAVMRAQMERMDAAAPSIVYASHPIFGQLTEAQWGVLAHKHLDHHLRQFGV